MGNINLDYPASRSNFQHSHPSSFLWNLTLSDIEKLERCQRWFVGKVFYLPNHSDVSSLQRISGLTSVELQTDIRKLFFFASIVSNDGMSMVVRDISGLEQKSTSETLTVYQLDFMV